MSALRQLIREIVRGYVDPDAQYDWSENEKWWSQFGVSPEDFTMSTTVGQTPQLQQNQKACAYCSGSGERDVGARTVKCDICDGTGEINL